VGGGGCGAVCLRAVGAEAAMKSRNYRIDLQFAGFSKRD
jgi:hypothetical protein